MAELDDEMRGSFWDVWCAVEIDGGHLYPNGYTQDLGAFKYLQKYFA